MEELQLALELYLDRDMQWHSKISNNTWEIMALSELLKGLDVIDAEKDDKFRSPSSIRLKFANFKSLDERYGNSAMANVGNLDKAIWNQYHSDYQVLKNKCQVIIETHYKGKPSAHLVEYLARFEKSKSADEITEYADKLFSLAKELRARAVTCEDIDFSQKVMDECCQDNYVTQNGRLRRLTPRECARLQGFPDEFKIEVSDAQAYKQFGNAVTVNVSYAIAKSIKEKVDGSK